MEERKRSIGRELLSWAKYLACAVIAALLINNFIVVNATIISGSMETTIMTGDRILCNRLAYVGGSPRRYDVVAFRHEYNGDEVIFVKRIIGLPGETVEILDGKVYINGGETPLKDSFVNGAPQGDFGPFEVPPEAYFVLGDNRNNSYDSKSWPYPYILRDEILGKALIRYYPHMSLIEKIEENE